MIHPDGLEAWIEDYGENTRLREYSTNDPGCKRQISCYIQGTPNQRFAIHIHAKPYFDYLDSAGIEVGCFIDLGQVSESIYRRKPEKSESIKITAAVFTQQIRGEWFEGGVCFGKLSLGNWWINLALSTRQKKGRLQSSFQNERNIEPTSESEEPD